MDHRLNLLLPLILLLTQPTPAVTLDSTCTVNILNRTVQMDDQGGWSMPNVPANMGQVRARVTCLQDGGTHTGQTAFFTLSASGPTDTGPFVFGDPDPPPRRLDVTPSGETRLTTPGATLVLNVTASYPDGTSRDVTAATTGTNYQSSNPAIASVDADGHITAQASGRAFITLRQDGAVAVTAVAVLTTGDADGDGLPDDFERANGLNPNDPIDALEDQDSDGLPARDEYTHGTQVRDPDSDDDGITDGEEVTAGTDGYRTDPLAADSDGDGLDDRDELLAGSDPTDPTSVDFAALLVGLDLSPKNPVLIYNTVFSEASRQLKVTGSLSSGKTVDLTPRARGTGYASSDLAVVSFGSDDGRLFAGTDGSATVTASNGTWRSDTSVTVRTFSPQRLDYLSIPGYANNVDVAGDHAYVAAGSAGLQVVDTAGLKAEPRTALRLIGSLDTPGNANDVRVTGTLVLIADGHAGLRLIDVSDPTQPQALGAYDGPGTAWDLAVHDTRAFVADGSAGLAIIDITNPKTPILLSQSPTAGTAKGVAVSDDGTLAVVALGTAGIQTFDISDPRAPRSLAVRDFGEAGDVALQDRYAYLAGRDSGFIVIDLSNPADPIQRQAVPLAFGGRVSDVALTERLAFNADYYFANAVPIIGIEDPALAQQRAVLYFRDVSGTGFPDDNGTGIALDSNYVYLTAASDIKENGTSGTTRLYVGQYLAREDTAGVAPAVQITAPVDGSTIMEGARLPITIDASDDLAVVGVDLFVDPGDGERKVASDNTRPYGFTYLVPLAIDQLLIRGEAYDLAGNLGQTPYTLISVLPDPKTTVIGTVHDTLGNPVVGAEIDCTGETGASDGVGQFSISAVPTASGYVRCTARYQDPAQGSAWAGFSDVLEPVPGGTTDVGTIDIGDFRTFMLSTGPLAYWRLGEKSGTRVQDESGVYHGTYSGAQLGVAGALLSSSDTAVNIPTHNTRINLGSSSVLKNFWRGDHWTAAIWVKTTQISWFPRIMGNHDFPSSGATLLANNTGRFSFEWTAQGASALVIATNAFVADGRWHYCAITYDYPAVKMYVDSVLVHEAVLTARIVTATSPFYIGTGVDSSSEYFLGQLDEAALWQRTLSAQELAEIYEMAGWSPPQ